MPWLTRKDTLPRDSHRKYQAMFKSFLQSNEKPAESTVHHITSCHFFTQKTSTTANDIDVIKLWYAWNDEKTLLPWFHMLNNSWWMRVMTAHDWGIVNKNDNIQISHVQFWKNVWGRPTQESRNCFITGSHSSNSTCIIFLNDSPTNRLIRPWNLNTQDAPDPPLDWVPNLCGCTVKPLPGHNVGQEQYYFMKSISLEAL